MHCIGTHPIKPLHVKTKHTTFVIFKMRAHYGTYGCVALGNPILCWPFAEKPMDVKASCMTKPLQVVCVHHSAALPSHSSNVDVLGLRKATYR